MTSIPLSPSSSSPGLPGPGNREHDARFGREVLPWAGEIHRFALALCDAGDSVSGSGITAQQLVSATLRRAYALSLGSCPRQAGVLGIAEAEQCKRLLALCRELFEQSGGCLLDGPGSRGGDFRLDPSRDVLGSGRVFATSLREGIADPWPAAQHLRDLVASLPASVRAPMVLVDVAGYPGAVAAEILGVDEAEFRARLFHGRRLLQERLLERRLNGSASPETNSSGDGFEPGARHG